MSTRGYGAIVGLFVVATSTAPGATQVTAESRFERAVVNLEYDSRNLSASPPPQLRIGPEDLPGDQLFHGVVPRNLPGVASKEHFVPFAVRYVAGIPRAAWCDSNLNGDLLDDPAITLSRYPDLANGRSFLVDLRWTAGLESGREVPIEWKIRVVLEPQIGLERPRYRLQKVFGMLGEIMVEGKTHRALLRDLNNDGIYANAFPDGMVVDLDDDLNFDLDPMSPDFGPFGATFQWGRHEYLVTVSDPLGRRILLEETRAAAPLVHASIGSAAPTFSFVDTSGTTRRLDDYRGRVVLIYFWASGCNSCINQAQPLRELYDRTSKDGLEILAVSYDTDPRAMTSFREDHGHEWPTYFTGLQFWENPIGRQYGAGGAGLIYLVSPDGVLRGIYSTVEDLALEVASYRESH